MIKTSAEELRQQSGLHFCLLTWASYEERCLSAASTLASAEGLSGFIVHFDERDYDISNNLATIRKLYRSATAQIKLDRKSPFSCYTHISKICRDLASFDRIIIDISCFPRDIVLILQFVLFQKGISDKVYFVYNQAADYSVNEPAEKKWLSRGITDIRPVLGFRGKVIPGRPICVLGLLGLDGDRLLQTVSALEPYKVALGLGQTSDDKKSWLYKRNKTLAVDLAANVDVESVFEFDCESIAATIDACLPVLYSHPYANRTIIPMNNKLSTLAVGALALIERRFQICYGGALIYNMSGYSSPSEVFYLGKASSIIEQARNAIAAWEDGPTVALM